MTFRIGAVIVTGLCLIVLVVLLVATKDTSSFGPVAENPAKPAPFRKVVWVDSYHEGYAWSDGIERGLRGAMKAAHVDLKIIRLDAKRQPAEETCKAIALAAKAEIDAWQPDVIIASDDHAQKYLIVPYYRDGRIPVIFCGVNWSAAEYGYPTANVTGMVEVDLVRPLVEHLKRYASGTRVAYFAVDDLTERKLYAEHNKRFFDGKMLCFLAPAHTFASYCETFLKAQEAADMVLISNNAGVADWNDTAAEEFFRTYTAKPTGAINSWMTGYALVTFCKLPEEQGEWAMQTAQRILGGITPSAIPLTENRKGRLIINMDIAEHLNVVFTADIMKNAENHRSSQR